MEKKSYSLFNSIITYNLNNMMKTSDIKMINVPRYEELSAEKICNKIKNNN